MAAAASVPGRHNDLPLLGDDSSCGPPLGVEPLPRGTAEQLARLLKAVADPTRLQMLSMLLAAPDGEACVCDLGAPLAQTQPTVSYHLKVLADTGLVARRRRGTWMWYSVREEHVGLLSSLVFSRV